MAHVKFTPEMVMIAEEITLSNIRADVAKALQGFEGIAMYPAIMTGAHATHAKARAAAYAKAAAAIEASFVDLDTEIGDARAAEEERDKARAAEAKAKAEVERVQRGEMTWVDLMIMRSLARGDGEVNLICPACDVGHHLIDGVCKRSIMIDGHETECNAHALDLRDPSVRTTVTYAPRPGEPVPFTCNYCSAHPAMLGSDGRCLDVRSCIARYSKAPVDETAPTDPPPGLVRIQKAEITPASANAHDPGERIQDEA